jgi:SagB-type dehydrogenase family enzyme
MTDPFFQYLQENLRTVSNQLYGLETTEKRYERLTYQPLPQAGEAHASLDAALANRHTDRTFRAEPLALPQVSALLRRALSQNGTNQGSKKYSFPSGGGFYPMETYLYVDHVEGLAPGFYHYSSVDHAVARIGEHQFSSVEELNDLYNAEFKTMPAALCLMTMVKSRVIRKYGAFSYKLCLIEAGHRGQNICLSASALGLATCPLGGGDSDVLHGYLGIDGVNEHLVYTIAIGLAGEAQT